MPHGCDVGTHGRSAEVIERGALRKCRAGTDQFDETGNDALTVGLANRSETHGSGNEI